MLEIKDLHVKFHNRDREAVSGVSLTIEDGEILGLVGESGSGKTVTAMSIAGLLPRKQCRTSGEVLFSRFYSVVPRISATISAGVSAMHVAPYDFSSSLVRKPQRAEMQGRPEFLAVLRSTSESPI